jgi:hypothetical protein
MFARPFRTIALACTVAMSSTALAQSGASADVSPDVTLRALENMNNAASSKLTDAMKHEASLRAYVKEKDLGEQCKGTAGSDDKHDMAMSFDQALSIAVQHEQSTRGSFNSPATAGEIRAYTTLAKSTWSKLQTAMANVEHLSDCVHGQGKISDFIGWSGDQQKSDLAAANKRSDELSKKRGKENLELEKQEEAQYAAFQASQKSQHEQFLKQSWTKYKFDQTNSLKAYKYRTEYGPNSYYNTYAGSMYGGGGGYRYGYGY